MILTIAQQSRDDHEVVMLGYGQGMASGISDFLRDEIRRRGWQDSDLADRAKMRRSALSYILNTPNVVPHLSTLNDLASALASAPAEQGAWLSRLINTCGYQIASGDEAELALLVEVMPELKGFIPHLSRLRPRDIQRIQAYIEGVLSDQPQ